MISRTHRFRGHGSLNRVYRHGRNARGPLYSLKYSLNPERVNYRLAVVVSRKVNKSAVVRNRIRRRLYASVRLVEKDIIEPYDMVITVHSDDVVKAPANQIFAQTKSLLLEAGIICQ